MSTIPVSFIACAITC